MAHITPIIKQPKLDKTPLQNYRPISNLSTLSKTLERVVAKQLKAYLHKYNILNIFQSAYTSFKSTETAITHIFDKLHKTHEWIITSNNSFTLPSPKFNNISIPYSHKIRNIGIIIFSKINLTYIHSQYLNLLIILYLIYVPFYFI